MIIRSILIILSFLLASCDSSDNDATSTMTDNDSIENEVMLPLDPDVAFLVENGLRPEVTVTASGLQYEILTDSSGPMPVDSSSVTVHYVGTLIDGTEFDSSVARGDPSDFPLSGVIVGFSEGIQLMSIGSKYRLFIPANLAYGDRGAGTLIKPGATLVFDVELLAIISS